MSDALTALAVVYLHGAEWCGRRADRAELAGDYAAASRWLKVGLILSNYCVLLGSLARG